MNLPRFTMAKTLTFNMTLYFSFQPLYGQRELSNQVYWHISAIPVVSLLRSGYVPSYTNCNYAMPRKFILPPCRSGLSTYASNLFGPGAHFRCCRVIQITNPGKMKESDVFFGSRVGVLSRAYSTARPPIPTSHRPEPKSENFILSVTVFYWSYLLGLSPNLPNPLIFTLPADYLIHGYLT